MTLVHFFFYLFSIIAIASAAMVVSSRNPVHSVLFLILAFFNSAGIFMIAGAEFLALILIVVYVGAVAVLFLFVVMMLDVDFAELRKGALQYAPVAVIVAAIIFLELLLLAGSAFVDPILANSSAVPINFDISNTRALGQVIYTDYIFLFQGAGLILLTAMIGAIVLTLRHKEGVKRQDIGAQVARTPETAIEVVKVESGQGLQ